MANSVRVSCRDDVQSIIETLMEKLNSQLNSIPRCSLPGMENRLTLNDYVALFHKECFMCGELMDAVANILKLKRDYLMKLTEMQRLEREFSTQILDVSERVEEVTATFNKNCAEIRAGDVSCLRKPSNHAEFEVCSTSDASTSEDAGPVFRTEFAQRVFASSVKTPKPDSVINVEVKSEIEEYEDTKRSGQSCGPVSLDGSLINDGTEYSRQNGLHAYPAVTPVTQPNFDDSLFENSFLGSVMKTEPISPVFSVSSVGSSIRLAHPRPQYQSESRPRPQKQTIPNDENVTEQPTASISHVKSELKRPVFSSTLGKRYNV